jgi:CRISPR-associated protein Cas1
MRQHANTLFVTTQGAYIHKDSETLQISVEREVRLTVPLHHVEGVVCFGRVSVSPAVFAVCGDRDVALSFLTEQGRFLARVQGPTQGNVLLRREQYRRADQPAAARALARPMVAAKIQNARNLLLRAAREADDPARAETARQAAGHLGALLLELPGAADLNALRGLEGAAASAYFDAFSSMIRQQADVFAMKGRNRRPPLDPVNSLLSFMYALLRHDCAAALETVGLDPAVGYLHADRPGRLSLALDLMEEFRSLVADRLVLALINRRQVSARGFTTDAGGAVSMEDGTRRTVLTAYAERKREEVQHPLFGESVPVGLLPHLQARLLARTLRGDLAEYPALVLR